LEIADGQLRKINQLSLLVCSAAQTIKKNKRCYQQVSSATVWRRVEKNAHLGRTFGAGIGPSPKSDESVLAKKTTSIEMFQKMVDLLLGFIPVQLQYVST